MAQIDRATLKTFFETNDFPTQAQFDDLLDSVLVFDDDGEGAKNLFFTDTSVSVAQLLAVNTTPVVLRAAPGANKVNVPMIMGVKYTFGGTAYATGGQFLGIFETDETGLLWVSLESGLTPILTLGADVVRFKPLASTAFDSAVNKPLVLTLPVADPTLGNGTLKLKVLGKVMDFT